jgi:integrase
MGRKRRGVEARGGSVRVEFQYQGERCRETLAIPPTEKNLDYAEALRGQVRREILLGTFDYAKHFPDSPRALATRRAASLTLSKAVDNWLRTRVITDTTRRIYRRYIGLYVDAHELGLRPIAGILASELELWRADLAARFKPKTVNNALIIVRGAFELAHADGVMTSNPAARLKNVQRAIRSDADPFTPAELADIAKVLEAQERNLVEFWWNAGPRHGEIFALEWQDIDWQGRRAHIQRAIVEKKAVETKTKRERFVALHPRAFAALQRQRAHTQLLQGGKVFRCTRTGEPWTHQNQFLELFRRTCARAGVRYRPPKQLRHTYASMALSAGEPPIFVMNQLGHTTLSMLERHYAKWMPVANTAAGAGFDALAARV